MVMGPEELRDLKRSKIDLVNLDNCNPSAIIGYHDLVKRIRLE